MVIHLDVAREKALECHHHVLRAAPAIARLLLEAAIDDALELARNVRVELARPDVLLEANLVHRRTLLVLDEWLLPSDHLVEHDTEGEHVTARVELVAEDLLWGHVGGRADAGACLGEVGEVRVARDAEVHDLHAALSRQHHVRGLDVAMDDRAVVHVVEGASDLHRDDRGDVVGQASALLEEVVQVDSLDVLHDDEQSAALAVKVVNVDDVFVLQRRETLGFSLEASHHVLLGRGRALERLDRDSAA